jgi:predicted DNA-binding transcriptional regulator YafY
MAQPVVTGDSRLASAATSALAKLTAAMPAALRERAAAMQQRLYVDNTSWSGYEEDLSALPAVQEAVSRDRKLAIEYRKGTEVVSRVVDPLGLVAKGSVWYLVALSEGASRTYRVSRIARATVLDVPSPRPPDFDLAAHWKASAARYRETRPEYEAILRVTPETARTISMWRQLTRVAGYEAPDDGRLNVRIQFESEEHARFVVLGLGRAADVVEPVELREYVHREAEAIVKRMKCARTTAAKPINESTKARPCPTSQRSR